MKVFIISEKKRLIYIKLNKKEIFTQSWWDYKLLRTFA